MYYSEIRIAKNDHLKEDFKQISPLLTLPTIKEESKDSFSPFTLCESHAIMRYLCWSRPNEVADHFYPRENN